METEGFEVGVSGIQRHLPLRFHRASGSASLPHPVPLLVAALLQPVPQRDTTATPGGLGYEVGGGVLSAWTFTHRDHTAEHAALCHRRNVSDGSRPSTGCRPRHWIRPMTTSRRSPTITLRVLGIADALCLALDQQGLTYHAHAWSSLRATLFPDVVIQLLAEESHPDLAEKLHAAIVLTKLSVAQTQPLHFADVVFLQRPTHEDVNIIDCSLEEIARMIATIMDD